MIKKIMRGIAAMMMLAVASVASADKLPESAVLMTLDGKEMPASKLTNGGKPMLISLWATWCGPCVNELSAIAPELEKWQKETGVKLVAVNVEGPDALPKIKAMAESRGWKGFDFMFEKDRSLSKAFEVRGIPFMIYVDGNGEVLGTTVGFDPEKGAAHIIDHLKELMAQSKKSAK